MYVARVELYLRSSRSLTEESETTMSALQIVLGLVAFTVSIVFGRKAASSRYQGDLCMAVSFAAMLYPVYLLVQYLITTRSLWAYLPYPAMLVILGIALVFTTPWWSRDSKKRAMQEAQEEAERRRKEAAREAEFKARYGTRY